MHNCGNCLWILNLSVIDTKLFKHELFFKHCFTLLNPTKQSTSVQPTPSLLTSTLPRQTQLNSTLLYSTQLNSTQLYFTLLKLSQLNCSISLSLICSVSLCLIVNSSLSLLSIMVWNGGLSLNVCLGLKYGLDPNLVLVTKCWCWFKILYSIWNYLKLIIYSDISSNKTRGLQLSHFTFF